MSNETNSNSSNSLTSVVIDTDNLIAAAILFFLPIPGISCYILLCIVIYRFRHSLKSTYYRFVVAIAFTNVPTLTIILVYGAPSTFHGYPLGESNVNYITGALVDLVWFPSLIIYPMIAVNRFISIKYNHLSAFVYKPLNVYIMIGCAWAYGLVYFIITLQPCCYLLYFAEAYSYAYDITDGAYIISWIDLAHASAASAICLAFNFCTFRYMYRHNKQIGASIGVAANARRLKQEKKIFAIFFVIVLYLAVFDVIFVVTPYVTISKWGGLFSSIAFIIHLSLDGIVNLLFNSDVRSRLLKMFRTNNTDTVIVLTTVVDKTGYE